MHWKAWQISQRRLWCRWGWSIRFITTVEWWCGCSTIELRIVRAPKEIRWSWESIGRIFKTSQSSNWSWIKAYTCSVFASEKSFKSNEIHPSSWFRWNSSSFWRSKWKWRSVINPSRSWSISLSDVIAFWASYIYSRNRWICGLGTRISWKC